MSKASSLAKGSKDMGIEIDDDKFITQKPSSKPQTKPDTKVVTKLSVSTNANDKALAIATVKRSTRSSTTRGIDIKKLSQKKKAKKNLKKKGNTNQTKVQLSYKEAPRPEDRQPTTVQVGKYTRTNLLRFAAYLVNTAEKDSGGATLTMRGPLFLRMKKISTQDLSTVQICTSIQVIRLILTILVIANVMK